MDWVRRPLPAHHPGRHPHHGPPMVAHRPAPGLCFPAAQPLGNLSARPVPGQGDASLRKQRPEHPGILCPGERLPSFRRFGTGRVETLQGRSRWRKSPPDHIADRYRRLAIRQPGRKIPRLRFRPGGSPQIYGHELQWIHASADHPRGQIQHVSSVVPQRGSHRLRRANGKRIADSDRHADGRTIDQLTTSGSNESPSWSPDGRYIAYSSSTERGRPSAIFIMLANGEKKRQVSQTGQNATAPTWSPVFKFETRAPSRHPWRIDAVSEMSEAFL